MALLIEYAVTGECASNWDKEKESPYFTERYASLRILGTPGKRIAVMDGFEQLNTNPRVLKAVASLSVGTIIGKAGTTAQVIGSIRYKLRLDEDALSVAQSLLDCLEIKDDSGESIAWISLH